MPKNSASKLFSEKQIEFHREIDESIIVLEIPTPLRNGQIREYGDRWKINFGGEYTVVYTEPKI